MFFISTSMYILYIHSIKTMFQIFSSYKINGTKNENALFFLSWALPLISFTFNLRLLYELKHKVRLSVSGIFHFRFRFVSMLQQEVLKFNDIYVSLSSPKTDLDTIFLTFLFIPLLTDLFISLIEIKNITIKTSNKRKNAQI